MPRVSNDARPDRDELAVMLFLLGRSYRDIGGDPRVRLSYRGARLAVQRGLATEPPAQHPLESPIADAYQGSLHGDVRAKEQLWRLQQIIRGAKVGA